MREYQRKYKKYYTQDTVSIKELEKFLIWLQEKEDIPLFRIVEFDTTHLGIKENKDLPYITRQYIAFYRKHGYIPITFNVKSASEVKDYAPTLTTSSGSFTGIGSVSFLMQSKTSGELWKTTTLVKRNRSVKQQSYCG